MIGWSVGHRSVTNASAVPINFLTDHKAKHMKYGVAYIMKSHILYTHPNSEDSSKDI